MISLTKVGEIYHHWFSLALYDLHCSLSDKHVDTLTEHHIGFEFEGTSYSLPTTSLDRVVTYWKSFDDKYATKVELFHTSALCRELDRFLFSDYTVGGCYHQLPFTRKSERADFFITPKGDLTYPVASGDYKKTDFLEADRESTA